MRKATEISRYVETPNRSEGIICKTTMRKRPLDSHMDNVPISFPFFSKTTKNPALHFIFMSTGNVLAYTVGTVQASVSKVAVVSLNKME